MRIDTKYLPNIPEDQVHRIDHTVSAGIRSQAISLVSANEIKLPQDIEQLIPDRIERKKSGRGRARAHLAGERGY